MVNNKLWISFVSILTVLILACGGTSEESGEPTQTPPSSVATSMDSSPQVPKSLSEEKTGTEKIQITEPLASGVFRRLWSDPPTLDPHLTGDTTSAGVVVEIFSGLVALDTELKLSLIHI